MNDNNNSLCLLPENLDPALIHRVLLTDAGQFSSLRYAPSVVNDETPTFEEFSTSLNVKRISSNSRDDQHSNRHEDEAEDALPVDAMSWVAICVKAAFRDQLVERMNTEQGNLQLQPARELLITLHESIRKLIPSRKDLHGILDDKFCSQALNLKDMLELIIKAALALEQLESPARAETTVSWIRGAKTTTTDISPDYIVTSMMYLLFKTELCEIDKQDYYLSTVYAPLIHQQGVQLTRKSFEQDYGSLSAATTAPITRKWLQELASNHRKAQTPVQDESPAARLKHILFCGWLEILFGEGASSGIPEILAMDRNQLESIRQVTRLAAAGSALFLFAIQQQEAASTDDDKSPASSSTTPICMDKKISTATRKTLIMELNQHNRNETSEAYTQRVSAAVIRVAREWNPNLKATTVELLQSRTMKVLQGDDPVFHVYIRRIKDCFWDIILRTMQVPLSVRSGLAGSTLSSASSLGAKRSGGGNRALELQPVFVQHGLTLFASDLAEAAWMAYKIINLAWNVYGEVLVEPILSQAIGSCSLKSLDGIDHT